MRALVIVNPTATTTTARTRDVIVNALGHDLKLDVATTGHRDHAAELAGQARRDGLDLVVALGGDGTVNETVNGLLGDGPGEDVPALAIVPGGSTNVLARNLGVPEGAVEATGWLLDALRGGRRRRIGLGRADSRWFTFTAGLGFDAEVVRAVEHGRARGRRASVALYTRTALASYLRGRTHSVPMTLELPDREPVDDLRLAMVSNCAPWTYLGPRGLVPSPRASFDTALDIFGLRAMRPAPTLRHLEQLVRGAGDGPRGRDVVHLHDVSAFTLRAAQPLPFQLDGDYLGRRAAVDFAATPAALSVVA
jgi:diacylglycerol kinase family enzyme